MDRREVYLDHNATTPLHPEVRQVMVDTMDVYGNPSSMHGFGREARDLVEKARGQVASFVGASSGEILFVGSGSEANNTVLSFLSCSATGCACSVYDRRELITTSIEHPCILETAGCLEERGVPVTFMPVDRTGRIDLDQLRECLNPRTGLVSVMMANNEIGTLQEIRAIADLAHEAGALMHTDAVQAVGKVPVDVGELGVDFLTLSAHKIYGPKGVGALYVRRGSPFCPLIRGGHQERGRRAGTENTLGIVGLGMAVEMRRREMDDEHERLMRFKKLLREGIESAVDDVHFVGHPTESLSSTLNVSFDGAEGESILLYLDLEGIAISTGSACASGSLDPSHVLLATGLPVECAHGSVRISMGRSTTREDIDYVLDRLPAVIRRIRNMSSVYGRRLS